MKMSVYILPLVFLIGMYWNGIGQLQEGGILTVGDAISGTVFLSAIYYLGYLHKGDDE